MRLYGVGVRSYVARLCSYVFRLCSYGVCVWSYGFECVRTWFVCVLMRSYGVGMRSYVFRLCSYGVSVRSCGVHVCSYVFVRGRVHIPLTHISPTISKQLELLPKINYEHKENNSRRFLPITHQYIICLFLNSTIKSPHSEIIY